MTERTIVITGASDGIGAAAAKMLSAQPDVRLVLVGRTESKIRAVAEPLGAEFHVCDYASLDQVRALAAMLAEKHPVIHVLANNAGGIFAPRTVTADGYETTFQVNHLAGLLLTELLMPSLLAGHATVIFTASLAAFRGNLDLADLGKEKGWTSFGAYGAGKLANIITARALQRRYSTREIAAASFHPGAVATSFGSRGGRVVKWLYESWIGKRVMLTAEQGADTLVWLATTTPGVDWRPGGYYVKRKLTAPPAQADSDAFGDRFLEASELLIR